jgi:DNA polymerase III subunit gamma/tau
MAHQSLYRRYRPQRFGEIRGQDHVRHALQNAVREGRWSHAYLFSGPRGTGKTSTARVLAKALNCQQLGDDGEPCGTCESCVAIETGRSFDLHELDAASHNKVDDIRDLIAKVHLGSPGRTKVYILDEVHMLSSGAENALLKTLEEPPDHVVFVLATTEAHKVVPTIRSRTQHFEFQLLGGEELADHLRWVIDDADLAVGDDAVEYALRAGGGSARDTLSALDLVAAAGGIPSGSDIGPRLARTIAEGDAGGALAAVQDALGSGREPRIIAEETLTHLRDAFLVAMGAPLHHRSQAQSAAAADTAAALSPAALTRSLEALGSAVVDMRQAPDPRIPLEVCLLRLTRRTGDDLAAVLQRIEALEAEVAALRAGVPVTAPGRPPPPWNRRRSRPRHPPSPAPPPPPHPNRPRPAGRAPRRARRAHHRHRPHPGGPPARPTPPGAPWPSDRPPPPPPLPLPPPPRHRPHPPSPMPGRLPRRRPSPASRPHSRRSPQLGSGSSNSSRTSHGPATSRAASSPSRATWPASPCPTRSTATAAPS